MSERNLGTARKQVFGTVERGTECRVCGRNVTDGRMVHCSDYCSNLADAVMGMLNWGSVRRRIVERDEHTCQRCGFDRRWITRGRRHVEDIIREHLPDSPEGPSIRRVGEGKVTDDEWEEYYEARDAWREERDQLRERFGNPREIGRGYPTLEVDHITPISEGGHPFDPANLQTLCTDCHKGKTAEEAAERAERRSTSRPEIEAELADFVAGGGRCP